MDTRDGLSRELSGGIGGKAAQTRFPIADNFFTYRRLIVDTHQDGKNKSANRIQDPQFSYIILIFNSMNNHTNKGKNHGTDSTKAG